MLVQPVGQALQAPELALVELGGVVGVVADEDLREVGIELLDVLAELVAVLEVELVLAGLLDRHRELQPVLLGFARECVPPNCSSTSTPTWSLLHRRRSRWP